VTPTKSVWIKHSGDSSGWPFFDVSPVIVNGCNPVAFDGVKREHAGPDTFVYVGPGVFMTYGACGNSFRQSDSPGFRLQHNSRLIGAGNTTLRLAACNAQFGGLVIGANRYADPSGTPTVASDIWVTDLNVDCNAVALAASDPNSPWFIQGVQLWGTGNCHIERVNVVGACAFGLKGAPPAVENFILCINSEKTSTGHLIEDCTVKSFRNPNGNGCCSAISLNCWGGGAISGVIQDCAVELNGERGWGFGGEFAYNLSCGKDVTLQGCSARGAQRSFNNDTWPNLDLLLIRNRFYVPDGSCIAVLLAKDNRESRFIENTIVLKGARNTGFHIDRSPGGNCLYFGDNRIISVGGWKGAALAFNCADNGEPLLRPSAIEWDGNSVAGSPAARIDNLISSEMGHMAGNTVNGLEWLWPAAQPNPGWEFPV
jgi:hypothetical protein